MTSVHHANWKAEQRLRRLCFCSVTTKLSLFFRHIMKRIHWFWCERIDVLLSDIPPEVKNKQWEQTTSNRHLKICLLSAPPGFYCIKYCCTVWISSRPPVCAAPCLSLMCPSFQICPSGSVNHRPPQVGHQLDGTIPRTFISHVFLSSSFPTCSLSSFQPPSIMVFQIRKLGKGRIVPFADIFFFFECFHVK